MPRVVPGGRRHDSGPEAGRQGSWRSKEKEKYPQDFRLKHSKHDKNSVGLVYREKKTLRWLLRLLTHFSRHLDVFTACQTIVNVLI